MEPQIGELIATTNGTLGWVIAYKKSGNTIEIELESGFVGTFYGYQIEDFRVNLKHYYASTDR